MLHGPAACTQCVPALVQHVASDPCACKGCSVCLRGARHVGCACMHRPLLIMQPFQLLTPLAASPEGKHWARVGERERDSVGAGRWMAPAWRRGTHASMPILAWAGVHSGMPVVPTDAEPPGRTPASVSLGCVSKFCSSEERQTQRQGRCLQSALDGRALHA